MEQAKGKRRVGGRYIFYGTRCQWQYPFPNTSAARTFGDGRVPVASVSAFQTGFFFSSCHYHDYKTRTRTTTYCKHQGLLSGYWLSGKFRKWGTQIS